MKTGVEASHSEARATESVLTTAAPMPIGLCAAQQQSIKMQTSNTVAAVTAMPTSRQQNKSECLSINTIRSTPHSNSESLGSNTGSRLCWWSPRSTRKFTTQRPAHNHWAATQGRQPTLAQASPRWHKLCPASIRCAWPQTYGHFQGHDLTNYYTLCLKGPQYLTGYRTLCLPAHLYTLLTTINICYRNLCGCLSMLPDSTSHTGIIYRWGKKAEAIHLNQKDFSREI
jgi:hypothetical protein